MAGACVCGEYFNVDDDGQLCLNPGTMGLREVLVFDDPGITQFAKGDYPWLARVRVKVQGGGGGSAGADADTGVGELVARPGGGGGGYSESLIDVALLGTSETIVVGAGGTAGIVNGPGGAGGASSFGGVVVANGGPGAPAAMGSGTAPETTDGIAGAAVGTGDITMGGGPGAGSLRLAAFQGLAGSGGESYLGHGGVARHTNGPGTAPNGYGGGAGGSFSVNNSDQVGAAGGKGVVIVELYG